MDMDREPLGDIPGMGKYQVRNTVTQIVPDRLVEWTVGGVDRPPVGHVYGWQLDPVSDTETEVTNYCDWTGISDAMRARREWPIVPVHMLERRSTTSLGSPPRPDVRQRGRRAWCGATLAGRSATTSGVSIAIR